MDDYKSVDTCLKDCTDALQIRVFEHFSWFKREPTDKFLLLYIGGVIYMKNIEVEIETVLSIEILDTLEPFSSEMEQMYSQETLQCQSTLYC